MIQLFAPAKLTWYLEVTGRREDGYHLLRSEMTTVGLMDQLVLDEGGDYLRVLGPDAVPQDDSNLVRRALALVGRRAGVTLDKQIPTGGGLGVAGIVAKPTPELSKLQADSIAAAAPFNLSQSVAGLVFAVYPIGSLGSAWIGAQAARRGRGPMLIACVVMMLTGLALMTPDSLWSIAAGLALLTFSFFGAHAICSGWAPAAASRDKAQASSLYLLLYYIGGGIAGSVGGIFWASHAWAGVAIFCGTMMLGIMGVALGLSRTATAR